MAESASTESADILSPHFPDTLHAAQQNVRVLLRFLIEAGNGRLQAQFKDTRAGMANPEPVIAVPPCDSYAEFLTRIAQIETAPAAHGDNAAPGQPPDGAPSLDGASTTSVDIPFLYWSQDFLAAVAAPATAASILITEGYVQARVTSGFGWILRLFGRGRKGGPAKKNQGMAPGEQELARWMASMVRWRERGAFGLILVVILLSTYSISGQLILKSRADVEATAKDINARIETLARDFYAPRAGGAEAIVPASAEKPVSTAPADGAGQIGRVIPYCDRPYTNSKGVLDSPLPHYQTVMQINICLEQQQNTNQAIALAAQELSWLERLDRVNFLGIFHMDFLGIFGVNRDVADWFGHNQDVCSAMHKEMHTDTAQAAFLSLARFATITNGEATETSDPGCTEIRALVEYHGRVAEAVLECLSLYLLPALYGALGALLATLRYVRGRVAASLLGYVDRGRIQQDWVLGLVLGAVIGLFADHFAKMDPVGSVSLSAIALLAGYNVSAVFGLFEALSQKIFGPATPVPAPKT